MNQKVNALKSVLAYLAYLNPIRISNGNKFREQMKVELDNLATGKAAVPTRAFITAMREYKMTPEDIARMVTSRIYEIYKEDLATDFPAEISKFTVLFKEADRVVSRKPKLIDLKQSERQECAHILVVVE